MPLKLSGSKERKERPRADCQRQPFTVFLICQDCGEEIELGDELVDVQVTINRRDNGLNTRLLLVTGPVICPTCKNMKVIDGG